MSVKAISEREFKKLVKVPFPRVAGMLWREVEWYEAGNGKLLGAVILDKTDADYSWIVLSQDEAGTYRATSLDTSHPTVATARQALMAEMAAALNRSDERLRAAQDGSLGLTPAEQLSGEPAASYPDWMAIAREVMRGQEQQLAAGSARRRQRVRE